jgi:serine/threonine-protein kinase
MSQENLTASSPDPTGGVGLAPGDRVADRYEIVRLLGAGGMGAVFEARHIAIGKVVALKVLRPELANDPQGSVRFLQEARAANEVRHRNIVEILDFGIDGGRYYMVMEYLRGESLAALMEREGRMSPGRIIAIMDPVLRALAVAHERGIVHRDIKPENIFLAVEEEGAEPVPKLLDFGIAKRTNNEDVRLTSTRMALGTPAYMAPEQVTGAKSVTGAADQYAVGVILYEALTGRIPHEAETYNLMIIAKVTAGPTPLSVLRPDLDPALVDVIMRALATEPAQRFPTVAALREALVPFRDLVDPAPVAPPRPVAPSDPTRPDGTAMMPEGPGAAMGSTSPAIEGAVPVPRTVHAGATQAPEVWSTDVDVALLTTTAPASTRRQGFSRVVLVVGLGALVLGLGVIALRATVGSTAPPIPSPTTHSATTTAPAAETVVFRIRVQPSSAEIALDGTVVGNGVADVTRPRDGRRHQLRLSAPGYATVSEVLVADADTHIDRVLAALPAPPAAPAAPPALPPVARFSAPHPAHVHRERPTNPSPTQDHRPRIDRENPF